MLNSTGSAPRAPLRVPALRELGAAELRDHLIEMERLANIAQASAADAMVEMARRAEDADKTESLRCRRPLWSSESRSEFVADEIAVVLSVTKPDAARRYSRALAAADLQGVGEVWRSGDIDARKVDVICDGVGGMSEPAKSVTSQEAATYAVTHTAPELRRWLSRRVLAADPAMAEIRRKRALADRHVMVTPLPDGVSELGALLPSVQARQIYDTVNSIAHAVAPGDIRTMDQRRADALFDVITGRAEPPRVNVQVVVPADTLLYETAEPGHVTGVGPITSAEALQWAGVGFGDRCTRCGEDTAWPPAPYEAVFQRLLTDPSTGHLTDLSERQYRPSPALDRAVRARDQVCRFPGCSRPATSPRSGTDLDHTLPWPRGQTTARNLAVLCRHHHRLKHSPDWHAELLDDGVMVWTTPTGKSFRTQPWVYAQPP